MREALKAGAAGYVLKDFPSDELVKAVRTVHHGGGILIPPPIAAKVVAEMRKARQPGDPPPGDPLTPREEDTIRLLTGGRDNKEIAHQMFLTEGTVKNYISRIYAKLGAPRPFPSRGVGGQARPHPGVTGGARFDRGREGDNYQGLPCSAHREGTGVVAWRNW